MQAVFANEQEYVLQLLPPEHPIWRAEKAVPPEHIAAARRDRVRLPHERGLRAARAAGAAAAVALLPVGAGPAGRGARSIRRGPCAKIDAALAIGINVLAYATNRELEGKEDSSAPQAGHEARRQDASAAGSPSPASSTPAAATPRRGRW